MNENFQFHLDSRRDLVYSGTHMTDGSGRNHMKYDPVEPTVWAICPDGRLFFALQEGVNGAQGRSGTERSFIWFC